MTDYAKLRERMVKNQLLSRDIVDPAVVEAMRSVPRHRFVDLDYSSSAYNDGPLPIGHGQTISQPYIVALMTQLLELNGSEIVLEVGTGSGYQAAVLGCIARQVHSIERHEHLALRAVQLLNELDFSNIEIHVGDGSLGLPDLAPFDAIIVTAAAPKTPQVLLDQLADGGRLVIPVGGRWGQYLERWRREGDQFKSENIVPVAFVPLIGQEGWDE
jgi:protein-L-isoaspartate(D-aspartate) O-methyltransferase